MDYEPIDLHTLCNAGAEVYGPGVEPPAGAQTFHGLPFQIGRTGDEPGPFLLAFGNQAGLYGQPISVPVGKTARHILVAHALLETQLWQGGPLGNVVADYKILYQDGTTTEIPIRERFEIGNFPVPWGQFPFLCLPDQQDHLSPRYSGPWQMTGTRQTEAQMAWPRGYFIWAWQNPASERAIRSIDITPHGQKFVVAAITLGHLDEWPFPRAARRPVKITLLDPEDAGQPFDLSVAVDRGLATYPYPLPAAPLDASESGMDGFGAALNEQSSPAFSEIAATPSATIAIGQNEETLARVSWGELEREGVVETPRVRLEMVDPGKNWVHVTVVDDETSEPVPCRLAFHSQEGVPFAPHGHHAPLFSNMDTWHIDVGGDLRLGQITYAYIDGKCQGWLPRGRVLVDVARGYEYEPVRQWVEIEPGQQRLELRLKRWINMNSERYFSGDTHVHFLSTQGSQTEAAGEDLNVVNLLQSQWGHLFTNSEEFTGRPNVSEDGRTIVYVSQENRQHILGHLTLLGLREPVMPWCSGGASEAELAGTLDTTLSHWADACHSQGGTVIVPHLPTPNCEPAVLIATGRADAIEMLEHRAYNHLEYYRYLNGGYRLPLTGGTDKMDSGVPVGMYRSYVYIPPEQEFNYENWCRGLRAGRSFLSGGALLWFAVEGQPVGSTLRVTAGANVEVEATARSIFPLHTLQIVQNGRVVAETSAAEGARELTIRDRIEVTQDSWLAARCAGPGYSATPHYDSWRRGIMAHTSPVYIATGEAYSLFDPATAQYMLTLVEGGLSFIRRQSLQQPPGYVTHHHGEEDHMAYLERPFHEAQAAIHQRMHKLGLPH